MKITDMPKKQLNVGKIVWKLAILVAGVLGLRKGRKKDA